MEATAAAEEAVHLVCQDGTIINTETGDIIGMKGAPFIPAPLEGAKQDPAERKKQMREAVLWATERRARAEARLKGITAERDALLKGIQDRYNVQINEQKRKIDWVDTNYRAAMIEFAQEELAGSDVKNVKLPWATLQFKSGTGALKVTDANKAAYSLWTEQMRDCLSVTIDLGAVWESIEKEFKGGYGNRDERLLDDQRLLLEAIDGTFRAPSNEAPADSIDISDGVHFFINAQAVPKVIPSEIEGLEREKPETPLGNFSIKH